MGFFLRYNKTSESAALWEHFADIICITMKQHASKSAPNWLIGERFFCTTLSGTRAYRDLENPGQAYKFKGKDGKDHHDPCLKHISGMKPGLDRYTICTIPSHAFYRITIASGKPCWELASKIWFNTIESLNHDSDKDLTFLEFAKKTHFEAAKFSAAKLVKQGWKDVGIDW